MTEDETTAGRSAPPPKQVAKWQHGIATRRGWRRAAAKRAAKDQQDDQADSTGEGRAHDRR